MTVRNWSKSRSFIEIENCVRVSRTDVTICNLLSSLVDDGQDVILDGSATTSCYMYIGKEEKRTI